MNVVGSSTPLPFLDRALESQFREGAEATPHGERTGRQELFYIADDLSVISVQVRESAHEFHVLSSKPLFRLQLPWNVGFYDVTRDGKRFLVNTRTLREQSSPLTVVTNWPLQLQNESRSEVPKN